LGDGGKNVGLLHFFCNDREGGAIQFHKVKQEGEPPGEPVIDGSKGQRLGGSLALLLGYLGVIPLT